MIRRIKDDLLNLIRRLLLSLHKRMLETAEAKEWNELKAKFNKIGSNVYIPAPRKIHNPQYISIGSNFSSLYNTRIEVLDEYCGQTFIPQVIIGNNVSMNTDCHIGCINKVVIGDNVLIASRVYIADHSHGDSTLNSIIQPPAARPLSSKGAVIIEDNVWLGEGVCVLAGVTIGRNSIIGANSVVNKDVPPYSVAAGVPAKVIKQIV